MDSVWHSLVIQVGKKNKQQKQQQDNALFNKVETFFIPQ